MTEAERERRAREDRLKTYQVDAAQGIREQWRQPSTASKAQMQEQRRRNRRSVQQERERAAMPDPERQLDATDTPQGADAARRESHKAMFQQWRSQDD